MMRSPLLLLLAFILVGVPVVASDDEPPPHHPTRRRTKNDLNNKDNNNNHGDANNGEWSDLVPPVQEDELGGVVWGNRAPSQAPSQAPYSNGNEEETDVNSDSDGAVDNGDGSQATEATGEILFCVEPSKSSNVTTTDAVNVILELAPACKLQELKHWDLDDSNNGHQPSYSTNSGENAKSEPSGGDDDDNYNHQIRRERRNLQQRQQQHSNPAFNNTDSAFFSGECGPHCRPSCLTLQLNVERYYSANVPQQQQQQQQQSASSCRHVRNSHNHAQQQDNNTIMNKQHPTCFLETAHCFGPLLYDDTVAYVESLLLRNNNSFTTTTNAPSSSSLQLDRCAAIPSNNHVDLDRLRDWKVVTPMAVGCNSNSNASISNIEDCFSNNDNILYFEYCHTIHEQAIVPADSFNNSTRTTESCDDDDNINSSNNNQRRTVVHPFPDGWTSFVVSASIPYLPADDEQQQNSQFLPYATTTHRACFAQRVDLYFAPNCPHCRQNNDYSSSGSSLLQLGDRLGALEVVGFGHAIGQTCAPCDRRSYKSTTTATQQLNCHHLQQCEQLEDCSTGKRLGLPNFVDNQCSFFDNNNTSSSMIDEEQQQGDYEPATDDIEDDEEEDDNWFSEEGFFADDDEAFEDYAASPPSSDDDDDDPYNSNSTCMLLYLKQQQENSSATTLSKQEICEQASSSVSETEGACHFCALGGNGEAANSSVVVELCLSDAQYAVMFDNTNNTTGESIECINIPDDYNEEEGAGSSNNTCARATIQSHFDNSNSRNSSNREACWAASTALVNDTDTNQQRRQLCYYCSVPETALSICLTSDQAAISQDAGLVCEASISNDDVGDDISVDAPASMMNVTDPDNDVEDTTVAGSTVAEQQDDAVRQHLLPIVTPIGAALGFALVAVLVLLHTQRKRARLTQQELERYRPTRGAEEIVYIDPVELDVIDKVLAPSEEEEGFATADESVGTVPTPDDLDERLKNLQRKGEAFSLEVVESDKPTTAVLEFQSASLVETPGRDEVEALYMTGQHIFTRRRSSEGSP